MRVRVRDKLLNVQPLEEITIISTLVLDSSETRVRGEANDLPVSKP